MTSCFPCLPPPQVSLVALLARGSQVTTEAMATMLPAIEPELLVAPAESMFAARPGKEGVGVEQGALVVFVVYEGIPRGLVCRVISLSGGGGTGRSVTCSLQRLIDGKVLMDETGLDKKWFPVRSLAKAKGPLGATPLHLACLFGCMGGVVAALAEHNPDAGEAVDAFGRIPLAIASEVRLLPARYIFSNLMSVRFESLHLLKFHITCFYR